MTAAVPPSGSFALSCANRRPEGFVAVSRMSARRCLVVARRPAIGRHGMYRRKIALLLGLAGFTTLACGAQDPGQLPGEDLLGADFEVPAGEEDLGTSKEELLGNVLTRDCDAVTARYLTS